MPCFINYFIQSNATWWKTTPHFLISKIKVAKQSPISATTQLLFSSLSSLVLLSISYAEIPTAVINSKTRTADFCQMAPLCVIKLINIELTDVFTTNCNKMCQKSHKLIKRSGLVFLGHCDYVEVIWLRVEPLPINQKCDVKTLRHRAKHKPQLHSKQAGN